MRSDVAVTWALLILTVLWIVADVYHHAINQDKDHHP